MFKKINISSNLTIVFCAFIAVLGLNVDLSLVTSLDNFRIEGYPIARYQEVTGNLSSHMEIIAEFFAGFSGNSVLWLCIFVALCMLFHRTAAVKDSRILKYSAITAMIFSMLYVVGFSVNKYNSLIAITDSITAFMKCFVAFIGIAFVFFSILAIFFEKVMYHSFNNYPNKKHYVLSSDKKSFLVRCALIFIGWLPYLIVYMPGFLSRDTVDQFAQAMGDMPLSSHHPVFMTGLFYVFIRIGMMFGSANIGLLMYSLFQMLIFAAAFSYVLHCMARRNISIYMRLFTLLFYLLYPVNAFYSFTMWKDSIFGVVFMMVTLATLQSVSQTDTFFKSAKNVLVYGLLCAALFLTRNNGIYILILLLPTLLLFMRGYRIKIIAIIGIFAISFALMQLVTVALDVQKGSIGEALSLPLQQVVRTVVEHGDKIPDGDKALIASILPYEQLPKLYDPIISDPIKGRGVFNEDVFLSDVGSYIALWARLLVSYPKTYIEAFLCQTHGYWYPDIDYWLVTREMWQNDYGIHYWSVVPSFIDNVFSGIFVFRVFPVFSMVISIGFAVWVTIMMAIVIVLKRNLKILIVFLPVFILWLSCLASPVSGMMRYIYGLFLVLPILISVALQEDRWCIKK